MLHASGASLYLEVCLFNQYDFFRPRIDDMFCWRGQVFCKMPDAAMELRQLAGLELKNTIKLQHGRMDRNVLRFVQSSICEKKETLHEQPHTMIVAAHSKILRIYNLFWKLTLVSSKHFLSCWAS
jgi:hypothetical protein